MQYTALVTGADRLPVLDGRLVGAVRIRHLTLHSKEAASAGFILSIVWDDGGEDRIFEWIDDSIPASDQFSFGTLGATRDVPANAHLDLQMDTAPAKPIRVIIDCDPLPAG